MWVGSTYTNLVHGGCAACDSQYVPLVIKNPAEKGDVNNVLKCNNCGHVWEGDYALEDYCPECDSVMIEEIS